MMILSGHGAARLMDASTSMAAKTITSPFQYGTRSSATRLVSPLAGRSWIAGSESEDLLLALTVSWAPTALGGSRACGTLGASRPMQRENLISLSARDTDFWVSPFVTFCSRSGISKHGAGKSGRAGL